MLPVPLFLFFSCTVSLLILDSECCRKLLMRYISKASYFYHNYTRRWTILIPLRVHIQESFRLMSCTYISTYIYIYICYIYITYNNVISKNLIATLNSNGLFRLSQFPPQCMFFTHFEMNSKDMLHLLNLKEFCPEKKMYLQVHKCFLNK